MVNNGEKKRRKDKKSDESTILKSIYSSPLKHYCPHVSPWKWIQLLVDQTFDISIVVRCTGGAGLPFYPPPPTHKYTSLLRHHDPLIRKITLDVSGINNYYMYSFSKLSSNKGNFCQSLPPKFSEKHAYCKESKLDLIWKIYFVA